MQMDRQNRVAKDDHNDQQTNCKKYDNRTFGTCGLNSTARCMASTAFISTALRPRFDATSTENLPPDTPIALVVRYC